MTDSRSLVYKTLSFQSPERVPRHVWDVPWTYMNYPDQIKKLKEQYPEDIVWLGGIYTDPPVIHGDRYEIGEFTDEWGCTFLNRQQGIIGEVKEPLIKGDEWEDADCLRLPEEILSLDIEKINEHCSNESRFVVGASSVRIFERLQFIRGTEELLVDLLLKPDRMFGVIGRIHDFNCRELEIWAQTGIDALFIQDDWGSQKNLLINPKIWAEIFKPLYRDYAAIAKRYGKKIFMHSDGNILEIIPHLIDIGIDALNSQIFCMGLENLSQFKGKITFWGEIDRQGILPDGTPEQVEAAVRSVRDHLWSNGGCIAQCDFGPGSKPDNVLKVFETWDKIMNISHKQGDK